MSEEVEGVMIPLACIITAGVVALASKTVLTLTELKCGQEMGSWFGGSWTQGMAPPTFPSGGFRSGASTSQAEDAVLPKMTITLLRNRLTKRVLYMEAGKDFVDLLFSFLVVPTGTILNRVAAESPAGAHTKIGAIVNILESARKLDGAILYVDKKELVSPRLAAEGRHHLSSILFLRQSLDSGSGASTSSQLQNSEVFYVCANFQSLNCKDWRVRKSGRTCPTCGTAMANTVTLVEVFQPSRSGLGAAAAGSASTACAGSVKTPSTKPGFVKKNVTFIVTDDLEISTASTIRSINLLNSLSVGNMTDLESCEAQVGPKEAMKLLEVSFTSRNALNDVFGPNIIYSN